MGHRRSNPLGTAAAGLTALVVLVGACGAEAASTDTSAVVVDEVATSVPATTAAPEPTPTVAPTPEPTATVGPTPTPLPTPTPTPIPLEVNDQTWVPFAEVGGITLHHPADQVQHIGFHESGHDGAQQLQPLDTATRHTTMDSRDRGTGSRTAADIVVDPDTEIRSPVSGTVLSAGTYILYCEHNDDFVFIAPDEQPTWQVKVFHIDGVQVAAGDRVEAGVTVLAPRATQLPFVSQVDEFTAEPSWPHAHVEVVDPSIPDRPSEGGGC